MAEATHTSKDCQEVEKMIHGKYGGGFRRFGALSVNFCMLHMSREKIWDAKGGEGSDRSSSNVHLNHASRSSQNRVGRETVVVRTGPKTEWGLAVRTDGADAYSACGGDNEERGALGQRGGVGIVCCPGGGASTRGGVRGVAAMGAPAGQLQLGPATMMAMTTAWALTYVLTRLLLPDRSKDFCNRCVSMIHVVVSAFFCYNSVADWSCPLAGVGAASTYLQVRFREPGMCSRSECSQLLQCEVYLD